MAIQFDNSATGTVTLKSPSSGTPSFTLPSADGTNNQTLKTNGSGALSFSSIITAATAVNSTSGTSIDFTSLPSWVKRITVMFSGVSTNGSSVIQVQIGSGSFTTSGYIGISATAGNGTSASGLITSGFPVGDSGSSVFINYGIMELFNITGNTWVTALNIGLDNGASVYYSRTGGGQLALSGTLDRVRITTVNGTDTFDAGTINILYEG